MLGIVPTGQRGSGKPDSEAGTVAKTPAGTQTLLRGLFLLECVADGISDVKGIAARLGTPRSTTHRMLGSLVAEGFLHHVPYQGYLLGPKLIHLGVKAREQRPVSALARPRLEALARETGDTVHLGMLEGDEVFYLEKISGSRGLEMRSRVGQRMPLAPTGLGKSLMLGMAQGDWKRLHDLAAAAAGSGRPELVEWNDYKRRLLADRAQGWVCDIEENEYGINCVGAPVHDISGRVVAAVSVASATLYMPNDRMAELGPIVKATADAISTDLGWIPT